MHLCVNVLGRKNKSMIGGCSLHSITLIGNGYQVRVHSCLSHALDHNYLRPLHIYINNTLEKLQTQEQVRTNNTAFPSVTRQLVYNDHTDLGSGCRGRQAHATSGSITFPSGCTLGWKGAETHV